MTKHTLSGRAGGVLRRSAVLAFGAMARPTALWRPLALMGGLSLVSLMGAPSFTGLARANLLGIGGTCPAATLTQPFLRWSDSNTYQLAPAGDFEGALTGWSLSGTAKKVSGSESFAVSGRVGSYSLSLPAGGVAVSPPICVTSAYPYFRFFDRAASSGASLRVEVVYRGLLGLVTNLLTPGGGLLPGTAWAPSPLLSTNSGIPTLLGTATLQLRFSGVKGTSQIDDVYVDPHGRG